MINLNDIEKVKKLIKSAGKPVFVKAQGDEFNRKIAEYGNFDALVFSFSTTKGIRQIDSGMNHVLAGILDKNKIAFGIDIAELRNLAKAEKAEFLARVKQNIVICRKAGAKIALLNCRDKRDASLLLISLGASTIQASNALIEKV